LAKIKYIAPNKSAYNRRERKSIRKKEKEYKIRIKEQKRWLREKKRSERREEFQKMISSLFRRKKESVSTKRYKEKIKAEKLEQREAFFQNVKQIFEFKWLRPKKVRKKKQVNRFVGAPETNKKHKNKKHKRTLSVLKLIRKKQQTQHSHIDAQLLKGGKLLHHKDNAKNRHQKKGVLKRLKGSFRPSAKILQEQFSKNGGVQTYGSVFVHSLSLFIISYLFVFEIGAFLTAVAARYFGIGSRVFYNFVQFSATTYSNSWSRLALIVIFAVAPFLSLFIWVLSRKLLQWFKGSAGYLRLFLVWSMIHGLNLFFGAYLAGVITRSGFVYTTEWIFMSRILDAEEIVFALSAILIMIFVGRNLVSHMLKASPSYSIIQKPARKLYVLTVFMMPWLAGSLLVFVVFLPNVSIPQLLMLLSLALLLIPAYLNVLNPKWDVIEFHFKRRRLKWQFLLIALAVFSLLAVRWILDGGFFI